MLETDKKIWDPIRLFHSKTGVVVEVVLEGGRRRERKLSECCTGRLLTELEG